ncbi:type II secretion system protein GspM [Aestuariirhabdus litorea]|uniref:MSHA biogenesis protein MshJ n=1 Tax=Aestuariirhabdus litorea TaxID=2528527 RepID=A0A3P3VK57_9GAMM|nr:type II secretion system protein GspM [Aestuariirhabdus litorea]RRJ83112.1 hypothetical protein D0544_14835 [Aestuariirhabdus litorea]RWW93269.1 hypothetical protein DZC74_14810 [Endozoicomonadaceae bacterium GTF-13]
MSAWSRYCDLVDQRNERERLLITVAMVLLLGFLFVILVSDPLSNERKKSQQKQQQNLQQMATLQAEIDTAQLALKQLRQTTGEERLAELHRGIAHYDRVLRDATLDLITPRQMSDLLQVMLQRQQGVRLLEMTSYSEPLQLQGLKEATQTEVAPPPADPAARVLFYRHGMQLELEGNFFAIQAYLKSVEQSPWNLFWEGMEYQVQKAPLARTRLNVFTLSRDPRWLGMGEREG